MLSPARRVTFRGLICIALGLIGLAVIALGITIWTLRDDGLREAKDDTANIAVVLAEQTDRSVQAIDLVATDIRDRFATRPRSSRTPFQQLLRSEATHQFLVDRLSRLSPGRRHRAHRTRMACLQTRRASGRLRAPTSATGIFTSMPGISSDKSLFVSNLLMNRVSGERSLFFTKRISGPKDEFLGIVVVASQARLLPAHLQFDHVAAQTVVHAAAP